MGQEVFNSYLPAFALSSFEQSSEAGNAWKKCWMDRASARGASHDR
jgi:hypothetical protein